MHASTYDLKNSKSAFHTGTYMQNCHHFICLKSPKRLMNLKESQLQSNETRTARLQYSKYGLTHHPSKSILSNEESQAPMPASAPLLDLYSTANLFQSIRNRLAVLQLDLTSLKLRNRLPTLPRSLREPESTGAMLWVCSWEVIWQWWGLFIVLLVVWTTSGPVCLVNPWHSKVAQVRTLQP